MGRGKGGRRADDSGRDFNARTEDVGIGKVLDWQEREEKEEIKR